jgi:hypothetical protein
MARSSAAASIAERAWGHALLHVGELEEAARHLRRAARLGDRAGSPALVGEARHKLAFALVQQGRPKAALREVEAAIPQLSGVAAARAGAQRAIVLHVMGRSTSRWQSTSPCGREDSGVQHIRALVHRPLRSPRHATWLRRRTVRQLDRPLTINNLRPVETLRPCQHAGG